MIKIGFWESATSLNEFSFNPDDPKDILNKIEKVIYSDETIEKLMNYGLIQVKKFSVENTFNALNDIYHKINSGI